MRGYKLGARILNSLFAELKRRNIFRVAGVYAVVGWLIMQVISVMTPALNLPDWVDSFFAITLIAGFPIAMILAWAFELTPEGMKPTKAIETDESITAKTGRKLDYAILGGLALVVGLLAFQTFKPAPSPSSVAPSSEIAANEAEANETAVSETSKPIEASIAVLPFADLSPDGDQEYFGDGIAEELLNSFAQIKEMNVAGRTSSFAYKGQNLDLREIGRVLGVATILEGSIRKQGERIRVTAQLIKADDGFHIWSETYDRDLIDIFAVQDDIAHEISTALMPHLMGKDAPDLPSATPTDIDAYENFLVARQLVHGRSDFKRAKTLLEGVIKTDPDYAPAYALLAQVEISLSDAQGSYGDTPLSEAAPIAQAHLDRAFALDPDLSAAHAAQGLLYSNQSQTGEAITSLERAIEINPNNLEAKMWLAFEYRSTRRHRDVTQTMVEVFDKDPLFGPIGSNAISQLAGIGELERAQKIVDRLHAIDPGSTSTLYAKSSLMGMQGNWGEAINTDLKLLEADPDNARWKASLADIYLNLAAVPEVRQYGDAVYRVYADWIEGDFETARTKYEAILAQAPENALLTNQYINLLAQKGDFQDAVNFFDATWSDLRTFEKKTFSPYGGPPPAYANLALSFQKTGRDEMAKEALARMRTSLDLDKVGGAKNLHFEEAQWQALTGDHAGAIATLEEAFASRTIMPIYIQKRPAFDPIKDHPDFIDLNARNIARINEERAIAGLAATQE